jgi:hypothetical protein
MMRFSTGVIVGASFTGLLLMTVPTVSANFGGPQDDSYDNKEAFALVSTQGYLRDFGHVEPPFVAEDDWLQDLERTSFENLLATVQN